MDTYFDILKLSSSEDQGQEIVSEPSPNNEVGVDECMSHEEMIEKSTEDLHQFLRKELKLDLML